MPLNLTPLTLIGGLTATAVGVGGAATLGIYFYSNSDGAWSNRQQPINHSITPPVEPTHTNNYLVFSKRENTKKVAASTKCTLGTDCQLFNWKNKKLIANESFRYRDDHHYVLNIAKSNLKNKDWVLITIPDIGNFWLVVQSAPKTNKDDDLEPTPPAGLISKDVLATQQKNIKSFSTNQLAIQSKRYHNDQEPTYITRDTVNHETFLIMPWALRGDRPSFFRDATDDTNVDQYIFKTIDEQRADKEKTGQLQAQINMAKKIDTFIEIYEIQDQKTLKEAISKVTVTNQVNTTINWDALAKENVMITKFSQMVPGDYYKFVFSDITSSEAELKKGLESDLQPFKFWYVYEGNNAPLLFSRDANITNVYCAKLASFENKCYIDKHRN